MTMRNEINAVDLAFVVDMTGSLGGLDEAAQNQMIDITVRLLSRDLSEVPAALYGCT